MKIVFIILFSSSVSFAALMCRDLFYTDSNKNKTSVKKVEISKLVFDISTKKLRSTLSGKLATVWRSEWKTKLSVVESNQYVLEMVNKSLTASSKEWVLKGLDVNTEGFTRSVHERISSLQDQQRHQANDDLMVRDKPAPPGAKDTTFTYYTKPITVNQSEGKHQLRIRTYLRKISYTKIPINQEVQGFDHYGNAVTVAKIGKGVFKVQEKILNLSQMQSQYGDAIQLHAPHGKTFKLEVKTALKDNISNKKYPLLSGQHMVQKLDISLSSIQVNYLFSPVDGLTTVQKQRKLIERVDRLSAEILQKNPDSRSRAEAVFSIIKSGILKDSDFLSIEGATVYHRTAFESKSGFQTTIDRDQGVYSGNMYTLQGLQNPVEILNNNYLLSTQTKDARHVELKVPVTSMSETVGIEFHDPVSAPAAQTSELQPQLDAAVKVFYHFVKNADHSGKFNYIQKNSDD